MKNQIKIWHISDTHGMHDGLIVPDQSNPDTRVDMVIHSGDASSQRDISHNAGEMGAFLTWYGQLPIEHKIFVAGNHDGSVAHKIHSKESMAALGITYLESEAVEIAGLKIYGSPWTPTFGDWSFMTGRSVIYRKWQQIPEDTDILITHGPPLGILDTTERRDNVWDLCGDSALLTVVLKIKPKLMCFGHIHNCGKIINAGTRTIFGQDTIFSNGVIAEDGKWGKIVSNGNIVTIQLPG